MTDNEGGIAVMSFLRLSAITNSEMRDEIVEAFSISLRDIVEEDTPSPAPGD